jgi:hypothetical protein
MGVRKIRFSGAAKAIPIILAISASLFASAVRAQTKPLLLLAQASATNISGNWFDSQLSTSQIQIVQNGSEFSFTASGVLEDGAVVGVGFDMAGNGHVIGNSLDLNYSARLKNGASVIGHCSGVLRKDDVIAWHCRDSNSFDFRPTWIRQ